MRIAYVTRQLPPHGIGGIGRYVETVARLVAADGHEVTVVCAVPGQARSTAEVDGVTVERFPASGPAWLWSILARRSFLIGSRLHSAVSARAALRQLGRFDIVEAPEWKAEGLLLRRRARALVVHLHLAHELVRRWNGLGLGPDRGRGWGTALAEWLEARSASSAHAVTATTEQTRTLPDGGRWLPRSTIRLVPPPIEVERWATCAPVEATPPVVLFVGHLEHRKAPEVLLEGIGRLAHEVSGLRAVFVGRSFPMADGRAYDQFLLARAAQLGVPCEVRPAVAYPSDVLALYGEVRVVAVPSRFETLSMVVLEGLACGRPVVMTSSVGAVEWVGDKVPDLVVPPDDAVALAEAVRPLLLDPHEARRAGDRGQAAVQQACSPRAIVDARLALYRELLGGDR
jgi:glycogen synthase